MRKAGIILPISSLPGPWGIGTLGADARRFVDFLHENGQTLWQILPVGPTGYGDSPYQSFSAFAGNPYFVDLGLLCDEGLLTPEEAADDWGPETCVDYGLLFEKRFAVLAKAAGRQNKADPAYLAFCEENRHWLPDYALFMAIKEAHGHAPFWEWPERFRLRHPVALREAAARFGDRAAFWACVQFFFFRQWRALCTYATARGVGFVGDIPIYVAPDSSDVWANPALFQLTEEGRFCAVAGVPPDAFSAEGQLWGNPLYDWDAHRRTRYAWWIARMRHAAGLYDTVRIDHFRGFASYYAIPAGAKTAEYGEWREGPGKSFVRALHRALPDANVIAEDLGFLTEEVRALLRTSGYPGMKVLQFAFDSREESDYLPHHYNYHTVVYTGTHDNTTTEDWQRSARPADVQHARRYLGLRKGQSLTEAMVRAAMASVADTAIIPLQDWLRLGKSARINIPSTLGGNNWRWRLAPHHLTAALGAHIREETGLYGRLPEQNPTPPEG